jgi:hypothetical protein
MDWPLSSALPQLAALGNRIVAQTVGDRRTRWAYSIGYIRALYDMARAVCLVQMGSRRSASYSQTFNIDAAYGFLEAPCNGTSIP